MEGDSMRWIVLGLVVMLAGCGKDRQVGQIVVLTDSAAFWADPSFLDDEYERLPSAGALIDEHRRLMFDFETPGHSEKATEFASGRSEYLETGALVRVLAREKTPGGEPVVKVSVERSSRIDPGAVGLIEGKFFEAADAD